MRSITEAPKDRAHQWIEKIEAHTPRGDSNRERRAEQNRFRKRCRRRKGKRK